MTLTQHIGDMRLIDIIWSVMAVAFFFAYSILRISIKQIQDKQRIINQSKN